jgi:hypothetical protein
MSGDTMSGDTPQRKQVTAIDEVFEKGLLPVAPPAPATGPALPAPPDQPETPAAEHPAAPLGPAAPRRDYLRELRQEYDREQEKGKLRRVPISCWLR